jgi:hypothetical protein
VSPALCARARATHGARATATATARASAALLVAIALAGAEGGPAAGASGDRMPEAALAGPHRLALVAPTGSRLGDELRRELEYSALGGVEVRSPERAGVEWLKGAADLVTAGWPEVVTVRTDERQLAVLSRSTGVRGRTATFALNVEGSDRASRRRACLTVVEYLRTLNAGTTHLGPLAQSDQAVGGGGGAGGGGAGPGPSPRAPGVANATAPGPPPTAGPTAAGPAAAGPTAAAAAAEHEEPEPRRPEARTSSVPPSVAAPPEARVTRTTPATDVRTWNMGVTTTIDFAPPRDHPTAHLDFLWYFPLGEGWWIRARADWPLLGVSLQPNGEDLRMWTFGASVGLGRTFRPLEARVRPYIGLAVGNRMALTDVSSQIPLQGRTSVTPSATVEGEGGVRLRLRSRAELVAALALSRDWSVFSDGSPVEARTAGNAFALHVALGVLFEF